MWAQQAICPSRWKANINFTALSLHDDPQTCAARCFAFSQRSMSSSYLHAENRYSWRPKIGVNPSKSCMTYIPHLHKRNNKNTVLCHCSTLALSAKSHLILLQLHCGTPLDMYCDVGSGGCNQTLPQNILLLSLQHCYMFNQSGWRLMTGKGLACNCPWDIFWK